MLCQNSICCVFNRVKHSLRRRTLYPTELQKHLLYQVYIHFYVLSNKKRVLEVGFEKTFYHAAKSVDIFEKSATITTEYPWGYGSVGRAMRSQRIGQGFESPYLHHMQIIRTLMISRSSYYFLQKTSLESKYHDEYEKKRKSGQAIARIFLYYKPSSRCCDGEYFFNKD